jgi:serine phosphatase RsbU (regulator of sigma subunit)/HAMP domain-containing protein
MNKSQTVAMRSSSSPASNALAFFRNLSIRWKIVLTTIIVTVTLTVTTLVMVFRGYKADRLAYVFENHSAQILIASARTREALIGITTNAVKKKIETVPESLARAPEGDEIFVEESKTKKGVLEVFWRADDGAVESAEVLPKLVSDPLSTLSTSNLILVTQRGTLIYSNNEGRFSETQQQQLYMFAVQSNMASGNSSLEHEKVSYAVGFSEIPKTNLIVATSTSLASMTAPLQRAMAIWGLIAAQFIIIGSLLQWFLAGRITQPILMVTDLFKHIARGNFRMQLKAPGGEMRPVVEGAIAMQRAIASRERRLFLETQGLKDILDLRTKGDLVSAPHELAREIIARFANAAPAHQSAKPVFVNFETQSLFVFKPAEEKTYSHNEVPWDTELLLEFSRGEAVFNGGHAVLAHPVLASLFGEAEGPVLVIPFKHLETPLGVLLIPLDPSGVFPELLELVSVSVTTVESMIAQTLAAKSATRQAMLDRELTVARQIQERTISVSNLSVNEVKMSSVFMPASTIGGDWMAVFEHPNIGIVNIYLGDVTGHGIDAAFHTSLMAGAVQVTESELKERPLAEQSFNSQEHLQLLLPRLNQVFLNAGSGKNMTMFAGVLEVKTGVLHYALLGHPAPFHVGANGKQQGKLSKERAPTLGSTDFPTVPPVHELALQQGDTVVVFTDGFNENMVFEGGKPISGKAMLKKVSEILMEGAAVSAEEGAASRAQALYDWSKVAGSGYRADDDVAILTVQWNG